MSNQNIHPQQLSHTHKYALPKWLSRSGQAPSRSARLLFLVLAPLFAFLSLNAAVAAYTEGVIYPGVSIAGVNVSGLTKQQAYTKLQALPLARTYTVKINDRVFKTTNDLLGARYDLQQTINLAYALGRDQGLPALGLMRMSSEKTQLNLAYELDYRRLYKFTSDVVQAIGTPPKNATVVVDNGDIKTVADAPGLGIDRSQVSKLLADSMAGVSDATFVLKPEVLPADIQLPQTEPAKQQVANYLGLQFDLVYEDRHFIPTAKEMGYWVQVLPDREINASQLVVEISEQEVRGYIQSVANQINKNPVNKKVVVANGKSSVEREGQDGIALNQEAAVQALMKALRDQTGAVIALTTTPVPFKTETTRTVSLDAPKYIEINLSSQRLWAYENGQVVYVSPITSGATGAGLGTVTGLFSIYYKTTNTYLNGRSYGYNYNVHVNYWMPFYLGYGLHDAAWRSSFGGSDYYYGGSHGCVNLPDATASFIYDWSEVGTPVWVHN